MNYSVLLQKVSQGLRNGAFESIVVEFTSQIPDQAFLVNVCIFLPTFFCLLTFSLNKNRVNEMLVNAIFGNSIQICTFLLQKFREVLAPSSKIV